MSPVIYCILPWKWKQWSYGYRMVVKRVGYLPLGSQGWLGATGSGGLPSIVNVWYWHNTRPGKKNQNLKFEVQFLLHEYCFCTIVKSKSHKSDHRELGGGHLNSLFTKQQPHFLPVILCSILFSFQILFSLKFCESFIYSFNIYWRPVCWALCQRKRWIKHCTL